MRMGRHFAANALTFFIVGLVVLFGILNWGQSMYSRPGPLAEARMIEVPKGAGLATIAERLKAAGAIENERVFRIGVRYSGHESAMKFGCHEIPAAASMAEIAALLTASSNAESCFRVTYQVGLRGVTPRFQNAVEPVPADADAAAEIAEAEAAGNAIDYRVTVAEGLTSWQVVEGLKAIPILDGDIAEVPPEGSLAPDTFSLRKGDGREALLAQMSQIQADRLQEAWNARAADLPVQTPEELLVLASIIEKETGVPEERGQVASVFVNRLNQGMRLETDPAVIYGVTNGEGVLGRGLRQSELRAETPYNTYVIKGLPPTPIANPGRASLMAAAQPADTPYVFFVADGSGGHAFAETLDEHNRNVAAWRKIEAERAATEQSGGN